MRYTPLFLGPLFLGLMATDAFAGPQDSALATAYTNPNLVVHPMPGENVLLYPGGQYGRIAPSGLKEPGEQDSPVRLHRPRHHTIRTAAPARSAPTPARSAPDTRSVAAVPARHVAAKPAAVQPPVARTAAAKAAPAESATMDMTDLVVAHPTPAPAHKAAETRKPEQIRVAKAEPAPALTHPQHSATGPRSVITFERNASSPGAKSVEQLGSIARELERTLGAGGRVQILAYAGDKGDTSSAARRLALKRAIIIRQLLIDGGIPSDRIDVRAMGGATDTGAAERVDIFLKG